MKAGRYGWVLAVAGLLLLFVASAGLILHFLPRPLSRTDYLVAGSVATLITLLALFIFVLVAGLVSGRLSFRLRRKR